MREFDTIGLKLCDLQASIFESSILYMNCGSKIFVKRFVYSDLARRFDNLSIINYIVTKEDCYNELKEKYEDDKIGKIKYSQEALFWMGYIYRYWAYTYELDTISIYKIIKPEELNSLYFPYHTLDPKNAIERIIESKGLKEEDQIRKGIEIYKKLLRK